MQRYRRLLTTILLSLGLTLPVHAQNDSSASAKSSDQVNSEADGETRQDKDVASNDEKIVVSSSPGGSRFEPSEEVSEDLSVSFPADI